MKRNVLVAIIMMAVTVVLAVVSFFLLPETVVTQFSLKDSGVSTMPKLLAIALPTLIGLGGAAGGMFAREEDASTGRKGFIVSAFGLLVFAIMLVVNL